MSNWYGGDYLTVSIPAAHALVSSARTHTLHRSQQQPTTIAHITEKIQKRADFDLIERIQLQVLNEVQNDHRGTSMAKKGVHAI